MSDLTVVDDPGAGRVTLFADGEEAGHLTYRVDGGVITYLHTEVDPLRRGQGLGTVLVEQSLELTAADRAVIPACPFVAAYLRAHPDRARTV